MDHALQSMNAQLDVWAMKIEALTARYQEAGVMRRFDTVLYLDELRALHAVARCNLDAFRTAGGQERTDLEPGMKAAWDELAAAIRRRPPP